MHTVDYLAEMGKRIEEKLTAGTDKSWDELVRETSAELKAEEERGRA